MSSTQPFDVICLSLEPWDEVWRRNQFVCATLARRYPEMKVLFVGLSLNVSHHVRRGSIGKLFRRMTWQVPGYPNITVTHPLKLLPDSITPARKINELIVFVCLLDTTTSQQSWHKRVRAHAREKGYVKVTGYDIGNMILQAVATL